jgi:hypothetical protein
VVVGLMGKDGSAESWPKKVICQPKLRLISLCVFKLEATMAAAWRLWVLVAGSRYGECHMARALRPILLLIFPADFSRSYSIIYKFSRSYSTIYKITRRN